MEPMEPNVWIQVFSNLGGAGILALVMYQWARRFMERTDAQTSELIKQMSLRIESVEKRLENCEVDRAKLHLQFADMLLKIARPNSPTTPTA